MTVHLSSRVGTQNVVPIEPMLDRPQSRALALPPLHKGNLLWNNVHVAKSNAERLEIFRHRYKVYIARRGADYPDADHSQGVIRDQADSDAILVYSTDINGNILSSFRIALMTHDEIIANEEVASFISITDEHRQGSVAFLARMCSSAKGGKDLLRLLLFGYYIGLTHGIEYAFLAARSEFQRLYERLGYYLIGEESIQTPVGRLSLFGASMTDYPRFVAVGSPYLGILDLVKPGIRLVYPHRQCLAGCRGT